MRSARAGWPVTGKTRPSASSEEDARPVVCRVSANGISKNPRVVAIGSSIRGLAGTRAWTCTSWSTRGGFGVKNHWLLTVMVAVALTGCAGLRQFPDVSKNYDTALGELDASY